MQTQQGDLLALAREGHVRPRNGDVQLARWLPFPVESASLISQFVQQEEKADHMDQTISMVAAADQACQAQL